MHSPLAQQSASRSPQSSVVSPDFLEQRIGLHEIIEFFRRHAVLMGICVLGGIGLGLIYIIFATPVYIATAQILISPKTTPIISQATDAGMTQYTIDSSQIESQIEILRSDRISMAVVEGQRLFDAPDFRDTGPGFVSGAIGAVTATLRHVFEPTAIDAKHAVPGGADQPDIGTSRLLSDFNQRLSVRRVGQSYVLSIGFSSSDPGQSARITNAVAAAYVRQQLGAKLEASLRGGEILRGKIDDLQQQVEAASRSIVSGTFALDHFPVGDAQIITPASIPLGKASPKTGLSLMLSAAFGAFAGILLATLRQSLDRSIRQSKHIESDTGFWVLGTLVKVRRERSRLGMLTQVVSQPGSLFSEHIRSIKVSIDLASAIAPIQCLGITSCFPGAGKSTLASNLADLYALIGLRAMVIDCDLRSGMRLSAGEVVEHRSRLLDMTPARQSTGSDVLDLMLMVEKAGLSSFDAIGSAQTRHVIQALRKSYDVILIDLPALSIACDARALGSQLDGILIVAEYGRTPRDSLANAFHTLERSDARIVGCVLNKTPAPGPRSF